jgi:hypothetical protein
MKHVLLVLLFLSALSAANAAYTRYFVASYTYALDSTASYGTIGFASTIAPARASIINLVRTKYRIASKVHIIILSVSEFKTKSEYDAFFSGKSSNLYTPLFDTAIMRSITKLKTLAVPVHDTVTKLVTLPVHDTTTIVIHDTINNTVATTQRTWYLRDLNILPNTGTCLTDTLQQVINNALALGGTTQIIISDEGTYKFDNATDYIAPGADVHLIYRCYPTDSENVKEINVSGCN